MPFSCKNILLQLLNNIIRITTLGEKYCLFAIEKSNKSPVQNRVCQKYALCIQQCHSFMNCAEKEWLVFKITDPSQDDFIYIYSTCMRRFELLQKRSLYKPPNKFNFCTISWKKVFYYKFQIVLTVSVPSHLILCNTPNILAINLIIMVTIQKLI